MILEKTSLFRTSLEMGTNIQEYNKRIYHKYQIENTMNRLNSLKFKVTELRIKCEKIKKLQTEKQCKVCRKTIIKGEEITFKDSSRTIQQHYHKTCFGSLLSDLK